MHKGTKHVGKAPQILKQSQDLTEKLRTLQKKLEKAISEEDFEAAVHLRDDINEVKTKLNELTA
jgi:protein arginine kinase activator